MKYSINVPFSEITFIGTNKRHRKFFDDLLFSNDLEYPKAKYKLVIQFKKINLRHRKITYLEEDTAAEDGKLYIFDTRENKIELDFNSYSDEFIKINVDPEFDLYYLYNFILEPLLIIWGAKHDIVFVHSSSLYMNKGASIFAAWRHTGKTSSIFSLAKEDIEFMGDDFTIIHNSNAYLYPKNINIFSYNFESYPWLYKTLPIANAARIKLSVYLKKTLYYISQRLTGSLSKVFFRLSELAEVSTNTKVTPKQLGLKVRTSAPIKEFIFITKANEENNKALKLDKKEINRKMLAITKYEIEDFLAIYEKYKYLYPKMVINNIESFEDNLARAVERNVTKATEKYIAKLPSKDAYIKKL